MPIVEVYNSSGTKVATYKYSDAWGNHSVSYTNGGASTGAAYNPFRYRGYYYDTDLGMYYLQSRYYDAKICRFINADTQKAYMVFTDTENNLSIMEWQSGTIDYDALSELKEEYGWHYGP